MNAHGHTVQNTRHITAASNNNNNKWPKPLAKLGTLCLEPPNLGALTPLFWGRLGCTSNTMFLLLTPTPMSKMKAIRPAVWPQYTRVTNNQPTVTTIVIYRALAYCVCSVSNNNKSLASARMADRSFLEQPSNLYGTTYNPTAPLGESKELSFNVLTSPRLTPPWASPV